MIVITEVAKKLENILNGKDTETQSLTNPAGYDFVVYTQGFHLDRVYDQKSGKNFIPVFISSMGGQFNPVQNLKQANFTIPVVIYFPVRFKNDFFAINEFLADAFVGANLNYGTLSGKAISNISVSQYGEIQELDLDQFHKWIQDKYRTAINVHEPWMSLQFTLYLSTADPRYPWGNEAKVELNTTIDGKPYIDNNVTFVQNTIQSSSEPSSQQILGETESESLPMATSYSASFQVYIKNDNDLYNKLIEKWFLGDSQKIEMTYKLTFLNKVYTRVVYLQSINLSTQKGQLATMTLAFVKKASI